MNEIITKGMPFDSYELIDSATGETYFDRVAYSRDLRNVMRKMYSNGIVVEGAAVISDELRVEQGSEPLKIRVKKGAVIINGAIGYIEDDIELDIAIGGMQSRVDRIVYEFNLPNDREFRLKVLPGSPAATPAPPSIIQSEDVHQLSLAQVRMNAGQSIISGIIDERSDMSLCGISNVQIGFAAPSGNGTAIDILISDKLQKLFNLSDLYKNVDAALLSAAIGFNKCAYIINLSDPITNDPVPEGIKFYIKKDSPDGDIVFEYITNGIDLHTVASLKDNEIYYVVFDNIINFPVGYKFYTSYNKNASKIIIDEHTKSLPVLSSSSYDFINIFELAYCCVYNISNRYNLIAPCISKGFVVLDYFLNGGGGNGGHTTISGTRGGGGGSGYNVTVLSHKFNIETIIKYLTITIGGSGGTTSVISSDNSINASADGGKSPAAYAAGVSPGGIGAAKGGDGVQWEGGRAGENGNGNIFNDPLLPQLPGGGGGGGWGSGGNSGGGAGGRSDGTNVINGSNAGDNSGAGGGGTAQSGGSVNSTGGVGDAGVGSPGNDALWWGTVPGIGGSGFLCIRARRI